MSRKLIKNANVFDGRHPEIKENVQIVIEGNLVKEIVEGEISYENFDEIIDAKNHVVIEDYVQIGSHCSIYSISTIDDKEGEVILKENCRIGTHSVIMPGVTVGKNSIIGAFSFVTEDIPDDVIAFGVPAKIHKKV